MTGLSILGCGHWGPNYLRILQLMERVTVISVCDRDPKPLERISRQYPAIRVAKEFSDILEDPRVQAVIIATPASTHYELVKKALQAGKHVLVEKPLALKVEEGEELVKISEDFKRILMVGHTFLYNPAVRKMKRFVEEGLVGKIYYLQAVRTHLGLIRSDVNALWDLAPHDISIFSYLLNEDPKKVSAVGMSHLKEGFEDVAFVNLFYDHHIIGNIHISWVDSNKLRQVTVIGSKARITFDDLNPLERLRVFEKGISIDKPYNTFGEFQLLLRDGDIISPKIEAEEPLKNVCFEFIQSVETGKAPLADGLNGLKVVRVMSAIQKSIEREGEPVSIAGLPSEKVV
ncbi:MAG TPA: Gfo/Idh/MocA family oxidoreductase [bacterium]|nr:Gfo/Idh/MocA family oxidoreductase [bacterium]